MMTENADFLRIKRHNDETLRRELYKLKREYEGLFKQWLDKKGEYLTATHVRWAEFRSKAIEYKELNFKVKGIAKGVEE